MHSFYLVSFRCTCCRISCPYEVPAGTIVSAGLGAAGGLHDHSGQQILQLPLEARGSKCSDVSAGNLPIWTSTILIDCNSSTKPRQTVVQVWFGSVRSTSSCFIHIKLTVSRVSESSATSCGWKNFLALAVCSSESSPCAIRQHIWKVLQRRPVLTDPLELWLWHDHRCYWTSCRGTEV